MTVRVLAFARARELLPDGDFTLDVGDGARVSDAWSALLRDFPALRDLAATMRIARNGRVAESGELLASGDELALLPPVGGG
jgi:molybdopterin converting factor small subunit